MPQKIMLHLNNGNYSNQQIAQFKQKIADSTPKPKGGIALSSSIIGRIHHVKPGCGSCGK
jgi:hypothetical protein